jgi:hypothetical protein
MLYAFKLPYFFANVKAICNQNGFFKTKVGGAGMEETR